MGRSDRGNGLPPQAPTSGYTVGEWGQLSVPHPCLGEGNGYLVWVLAWLRSPLTPKFRVRTFFTELSEYLLPAKASAWQEHLSSGPVRPPPLYPSPPPLLFLLL